MFNKFVRRDLSTKTIKIHFSLLFAIATLFSPFSLAILNFYFPDVLPEFNFNEQLLNSGIALIVSLLIYYICSFRKPGTLFLTFCIWVSVILLPFCAVIMFLSFFMPEVGLAAKKISRDSFLLLSFNQKLSFHLLNSLFDIISGILLFYLFVYQVNLRRKNYLMQYKNSLKSGLYTEIYSKIKSAESKNKLKQLKSELKAAYPELKRMIHMKYQQKLAKI